MKEVLPETYKSLKIYLEQNHLKPRKKFGQNFLINKNILNKIISHATLEKKDVVLEIGPGLGHLSEHIIEKVSHFLCVEKDFDLAKILEKQFGEYSQFQLLTMDVLETKNSINPILLKTLNEKVTDSYKIISNLPYNVSAPVIINFLEEPRPKLSVMVVTVQKEVAQRLVAKPGTKQYGPLSLYAQLRADIKCVGEISPHFFYPQPKIDSTVVKMIPKPLIKNILDRQLFKKVVSSIFHKKRKTIFNNLRHAPFLKIKESQAEKVLMMTKIPLKQRGETLCLEEFIDLANNLYQILNIGAGCTSKKK